VPCLLDRGTCQLQRPAQLVAGLWRARTMMPGKGPSVRAVRWASRMARMGITGTPPEISTEWRASRERDAQSHSYGMSTSDKVVHGRQGRSFPCMNYIRSLLQVHAAGGPGRGGGGRCPAMDGPPWWRSAVNESLRLVICFEIVLEVLRTYCGAQTRGYAASVPQHFGRRRGSLRLHDNLS
jgi:hypothetical protein